MVILLDNKIVPLSKINKKILRSNLETTKKTRRFKVIYFYHSIVIACYLSFSTQDLRNHSIIPVLRVIRGKGLEMCFPLFSGQAVASRYPQGFLSEKPP